jgi:ATP-dependent Clp protease ATP-binding subunit ClpC
MLKRRRTSFKPELINRIDELIVFRQLVRDDVVRILDLEVTKVKDRLSGRRIEIHLTDSAREFLLTKGFDPTYGARPLRRAVERYLEDPLAEEILRGHIGGGTEVVEVTAEGDHLKFGQLAGAS